MSSKKQSGSITPFLTLILILLLAMIGTLLETARVQTGKNIAKEALNTAVESELSQFYLPLYEDYHLFFMERGIDTEEMEQKELLESIQEYILYTFHAEQGLAGSNRNLYSDFYGLQLEHVDISKIVRATEFNGNLLWTQAIEYSKYNSVGNALNLFSEQLEMFRKSQKASEIIEKKLETEESLSEASSSILEIMELVEGISCNKNKTALAFTKAGGLKAEMEFAKKFCSDTITADHVGVESNIVWNLLKDKYQTPVAVLEEVKENMGKLEKTVETIEEFSQEIENLHKITTTLEGKLQQKNEEKQTEETTLSKLKEEEKKLQKDSGQQSLSQILEEEKETSLALIQKQIKISRKKIKKLSETIKEIEADMNKNLDSEWKIRQNMQQKKDGQKALVKKINTNIQSVVKEAKEVQKTAEKAVAVIPKLKEKQSQAQKKLQEYRTVFTNEKEGLTEELKASLEEDLEKLEQYAAKENGKNSYITCITNMKPILQRNIKILKQVHEIADIKVSLENLQICKEQKKRINQVIRGFKEYHISTLKFDYRTLQLKSDTKNPIDAMNSSLTEGVLEMVLPSKVMLSSKKLPKEDYYYSHYVKSATSKDKDTLVDYQQSLKKSQEDGIQSDIIASFGSYGIGKEDIQKNSQQLLKKMLFQQYCAEHFKSFTDVLEEDTTKVSLKKQEINTKSSDTVLEYEQEYLLAGKAADKDNLKAAVNKIIFIRTIINFTYLMTDAKKKEITYATAAALVGFTGLEPLVRVTQTIILLTWAYEEALVDTGALLAGKKIPFMKDKNNFLLKYEEMFCISKALIQKKTAMVKDNKAALSMGYKEYIQIFFMLQPENKKSYRAMDLIEANLRKRNSNEFTFSRAIYGMDVSVDIFIKPRFLHLPGVQDFISKKEKEWRFCIQQSHAY